MLLLRKITLQRDISYLMLYAINLCGVFPVKNQTPNAFVKHAWLTISFIGCSYMSLTSLFIIIINYRNFFIIVNSLLNIMTVFACFSANVATFLTRKSVSRIIHLIDRGFYAYTDEFLFKVPNSFSTILA